MSAEERHYDVLIIGGGPAGAILASLLGQHNYRTLLVERDIHPRGHVGESLTPSTNPIFERIGFLPKIEDAGFVHKPGACWTAPLSPVGKFLALRLNEFPPPGATQLYTYNVERDEFDALLLRHSAELGAKVLQGVRVQQVLFEEDRAVGVRVKVADGWERDIFARFVVDASGRACVLASQLGLKKKDESFNQLGLYTWYRGLAPHPPGHEGMLFLHFLGLEKAWAWQIPLRNGVSSVGVVTDNRHFRRGKSNEADFFHSMLARNRTLAHNIRGAERIRPFSTEGDYTYKIETLTGKGWMLVGDALRFVDPVFSTGVDVAAYSALYAFETIDNCFKGEDENCALVRFERRLSEGVETWYELINLFYKLQNLFTLFAVKRQFRERVIRVLQGNLYIPESVERAREIIDVMNRAYECVMRDPNNILRPGALRRESTDPNDSASPVPVGARM